MVVNNFFLYSGKILGELGWNILYFPLWWYSRGLIILGEKLILFLHNQERSLGLSVWMKNIFRPMFGQYDWQGRLISFFVRVFQIIIRGLAMFFWIIIALAVFLFWIILPPFIIFEIIFQLHAF